MRIGILLLESKTLGEMVEEVIAQTIFFRTVGLIDAMAVHSGELSVPETDEVKPVLVCDFVAEVPVMSGVMADK